MNYYVKPVVLDKRCDLCSFFVLPCYCTENFRFVKVFISVYLNVYTFNPVVFFSTSISFSSLSHISEIGVTSHLTYFGNLNGK